MASTHPSFRIHANEEGTDPAPRAVSAGALTRQEAALRLRKARSQVIGEWEKRCRASVSAARSTDRKSLQDSVPAFLDRLAQSLEKAASPVEAEANAEAALEHGEERAHLGNYTLDQVLHEYQLLREVLEEFLDAEPPLARDARRILHRFMDQGIRKASSRFAMLVQHEAATFSARFTFEHHQLETIFRNSPAAMVLWRGPNFIFEKVNARYQAIFPDRQLTGRAFLEACPEFIGQPFFDLLTQVLRTGEPFIGREVLARHPDHLGGPLVDHYYDFIYMLVTDPDGKPYGVYDHAMDVTEKVQARKRLEGYARELATAKEILEVMVRESPAAIGLMRGPDFIFEMANNRWRGTMGERKYIGRPYRDVYPELVGSPAFQSIRDTFETGQPYTANEMKLQVPVASGELEDQYFDYTNIRISDGAGRPYGVFCHALNVTDKVAARIRLTEALRARDELLSICSHELRTPVASMKLSTQMFRRGLEKHDPRATSPERIQKMVEQSDRQLDRLTRLIEEMLDFSRINGGRLQINPDDFDLTEMVVETTERLRPQFEAAGGTIVFDRPAPIFGHWDRFRMEQVLINLLTNALKYGAGKPVSVALRATGEWAILSVCDQGIGISPEDQERIFKPYERAVSVNSVSGLGLGLFISGEIIQAHQGTIEVESAIGQGSRFTVKLPRSYAAAKPPGQVD